MRGLKIRSADTLTDWSAGIAAQPGGGTVKEAIDAKMPLTGGTFTGTVSVPDDAVLPSAAVNLAQVENLIATNSPATNAISQDNSSLTITDVGPNSGLDLVLNGAQTLNASRVSGDPRLWYATLRSPDLQQSGVAATLSSTKYDSVGNIFITGSYTSEEFGSWSHGGLVAKLSPTGSVLWVKSIVQTRYNLVVDVRCEDVCIDNDGNLWVLAVCDVDAVHSVVKLDPSGSTILSITPVYANPPSINFIATTITVLNGDVYVVGEDNNATISAPQKCIVTKITTAGGVVWHSIITTPADYKSRITDIVVDPVTNNLICMLSYVQYTTSSIALQVIDSATGNYVSGIAAELGTTLHGEFSYSQFGGVVRNQLGEYLVLFQGRDGGVGLIKFDPTLSTISFQHEVPIVIGLQQRIYNIAIDGAGDVYVSSTPSTALTLVETATFIQITKLSGVTGYPIWSNEIHTNGHAAGAPPLTITRNIFGNEIPGYHTLSIRGDYVVHGSNLYGADDGFMNYRALLIQLPTNGPFESSNPTELSSVVVTSTPTNTPIPTYLTFAPDTLDHSLVDPQSFTTEYSGPGIEYTISNQPGYTYSRSDLESNSTIVTVSGDISIVDRSNVVGTVEVLRLSNNGGIHAHNLSTGAFDAGSPGMTLTPDSTGRLTWVSNLTNTPSGNITSTTVQGALNELDALKVSKTSDTGSAVLPTGDSSLRDATPLAGYIRFNTTLNQFEGYNGTGWVPLGGGATGAPGNAVFTENDQIVTGDYTLTAGKNAVSAGPITIADGVLVSIPPGAVWVIV